MSFEEARQYGQTENLRETMKGIFLWGIKKAPTVKIGLLCNFDTIVFLLYLKLHFFV